MVCFASFQYQVAVRDVNIFVANATRYFPGVEWSVTCGDMSIKSTDLDYAIGRLRPTDQDVLVFETGRIWDSLSFWQSLPRIQPCEVPEELRRRLSPQVDLALHFYNDEHAQKNVNQSIDWTTVPQFMTLIHEITPIVSYFALPSRGMIIYESASRHGGEPGLQCIYVKDGKFTHTYGPHIVFDIDDGFVDAHGAKTVPPEFTEAFGKWVANGRIGPVLQ